MRAVHRVARKALPTYRALCEHVRTSAIVVPDATGWRVNAELHGLWAFATTDTTVYAIRPGRGFEDAATVLGPAFDGVLVRDGCGPLVNAQPAPPIAHAPKPTVVISTPLDPSGRVVKGTPDRTAERY